jgi:hypothetical protein
VGELLVVLMRVVDQVHLGGVLAMPTTLHVTL